MTRKQPQDQTERELLDILGKYKTLSESIGYDMPELVVLRHGLFFDNVARHADPGTPRKCFLNSFSRTNGDRLIYCEGIAVNRDLMFPALHAWEFNLDTWETTDSTWEDPENCIYFGIPINSAWHLEHIKKNKERSGGYYPGIFINEYSRKNQILINGLPDGAVANLRKGIIR